jgi:hypothetical protein
VTSKEFASHSCLAWSGVKSSTRQLSPSKELEDGSGALVQSEIDFENCWVMLINVGSKKLQKFDVP